MNSRDEYHALVCQLEELGATRERKETDEGKTKSGWWMDTVWLAPLGDPKSALSALLG